MSPIKDWSEAFYALAHEIEVLIEVGDIEEFSLTPTMQEYIDIMKDVGFREAKVLGWVIKGWNSMDLHPKRSRNVEQMLWAHDFPF